MEFSTSSVAPEKIKTTTLAVGVHADGQLTAAAEALDEASGGAIGRVTKTEFKGEHGKVLMLRELSGVAARRVLLVGLGKPEELTARRYVAALGAAARALPSGEATDAASALLDIEVPGVDLKQRARQLAMAALQANYHYDATLSKSDKPAPELKKCVALASRANSATVKQGLREGSAIGTGMN